MEGEQGALGGRLQEQAAHSAEEDHKQQAGPLPHLISLAGTIIGQ